MVKKRIAKTSLAFMLALTLTFGLAVAPAWAQTREEIEQVASYSELYSIVYGELDKAYDEVGDQVKQAVATLVKEQLGDPSNITALKQLATPLIKQIIATELANRNITNTTLLDIINKTVDKAMEINVVEQVLSNEFVQAVLNRAIDYAVDDIYNQLNVKGDIDKKAKQIADTLYAANTNVDLAGLLGITGTAADLIRQYSGLLNGYMPTAETNIYYLYDGEYATYHTPAVPGIPAQPIKIMGRIIGYTPAIPGIPSQAIKYPTGLEVTGWNTSLIKTTVKTYAVAETATRYQDIIDTLQNTDYSAVITNALKRATVDEVNYRITLIRKQVRVNVTECLQAELAKIKVTVSLNPDDSCEKIFKDVETAIIAKATSDVQAAASAAVAAVSKVVQPVVKAVSSLLKLFKK